MKACNHFSILEPLESRIAPASILVTNLQDSGAGSLRQAINDANAAPGQDTIGFAAKLHGTIALNSEIAITDDVIMNGNGGIKLSGGHSTRIFDISDNNAVADHNVQIRALTFVDALGTGSGGAISCSENLTLKNCGFFDNSSSKFGGAVIVGAASPSNLSIIHCTFSGNSSPGSGGALFATSGSILVKNTSFTNNSSENGSGAAYLQCDTGRITNSSFIGNKATAPLTGGAITISHAASFVIEKSRIAGNEIRTGMGGGVSLDHADVTLSQCVVSNNSADQGGGIYVANTSSLIVRSSVISDNLSNALGGGIFAQGYLLVDSSKILRNTADTGGGIATLTLSASTFEMDHSVVADNDASSSGGGLFLSNQGSQTISESKILRNQSGQDGGGFFSRDATLRVLSTIIASNTAHHGGGAALADSYLEWDSFFIDCRVDDNHATIDGGGIYSTRVIPPVLQDTTLAGDTGGANPLTSGQFVIN